MLSSIGSLQKSKKSPIESNGPTIHIIHRALLLAPGPGGPGLLARLPEGFDLETQASMVSESYMAVNIN